MFIYFLLQYSAKWAENSTFFVKSLLLKIFRGRVRLRHSVAFPIVSFRFGETFFRNVSRFLYPIIRDDAHLWLIPAGAIFPVQFSYVLVSAAARMTLSNCNWYFYVEFA